MGLLQRLGNQILDKILIPESGFADSYDDFVVFLYVHFREHRLGDSIKLADSGELRDRAYEWLEDCEPLVVAEGVDFFTGSQEKVKLLTAEIIADPSTPTTEKKTPLPPL